MPLNSKTVQHKGTTRAIVRFLCNDSFESRDALSPADVVASSPSLMCGDIEFPVGPAGIVLGFNSLTEKACNRGGPIARRFARPVKISGVWCNFPHPALPTQDRRVLPVNTPDASPGSRPNEQVAAS